MSEKLSREDLEKWAQTLDAERAPYSSQIQAENSFFVDQLNSRSGEEYTDIRELAEKDYSESQEESKKWKHLSWGSLGAGIAVNLVTGGTVGLAALVGGFAGMMYSGSRSSKEEVSANEGAHFVVQLDDVAESITRDSGTEAEQNTEQMTEESTEQTTETKSADK